MSNPGFSSRHYRKPGGTAAMRSMSTIFNSFKKPPLTPNLVLLRSIKAHQLRGLTLREIAEDLRQPIERIQAIVTADLERSL